MIPENKKIGRPRKEETKVIRLPVEIADSLKNMDESELYDFCKQIPLKKIIKSRKETKVIRLPVRIAERIKSIPEEELFAFCNNKQMTFGFDEQTPNQTDYHICTTPGTPFETQNFPLSDTPPFPTATSESEETKEVVEKWNKLMADSKNPNQPLFKKINKLLAELEKVNELSAELKKVSEKA